MNKNSHLSFRWYMCDNMRFARLKYFKNSYIKFSSVQALNFKISISNSALQKFIAVLFQHLCLNNIKSFFLKCAISCKMIDSLIALKQIGFKYFILSYVYQYWTSLDGWVKLMIFDQIKVVKLSFFIENHYLKDRIYLWKVMCNYTRIRNSWQITK